MLLQLALPGWSAVADAHVVRSQPGRVHLESEACVPSHPDDCALCSFLQTPVDLPAQVSFTPALATLHVEGPADRLSRPIGAIDAAPLPRAPPRRS
jgi:hypothetical protein